MPKVSLLPSAEHRLPGAAPGSKNPAGQGDELFEVDLIAFGWRATLNPLPGEMLLRALAMVDPVGVIANGRIACSASALTEQPRGPSTGFWPEGVGCNDFKRADFQGVENAVFISKDVPGQVPIDSHLVIFHHTININAFVGRNLGDQREVEV